MWALTLLPCLVHADTFTFVVVGDTQTGQTFLPEIVDEALAENAEFVLFCGDLTDDGTVAEFQQWLGTVQPLYDAGVGVYPIRGNHDSIDSTEPNPLSVWNSTFSGPYALPGNGPAGEENLTYSLTHKTAFVVGLDQFVTLYRNNVSWLRDQLASNTQPHVFVFGHTAAFNISHAGTIGLFDHQRDIFVDSLVNANGRSYFCGHDHFYNHALLEDGDNDPNNDLHQFILNSDSKLYDTRRYFGEMGVRTPVQVDHQSAVGYLRVSINGLEVTMTWMQRNSVYAWQAGDYLPGDTFSYTASDIMPPLLIPDPALKAAISSQLGGAEPDMENILALTQLDANSLGIQDLGGLEYAVNLETLYLNDNRVTSTPSLSFLEKLQLVEMLDNPLDREFYCIDEPLILESSPGAILRVDGNPDPNNTCEVFFADANLKTVVETELGVASPTLLQMRELFGLWDSANQGINDITGLESARHCLEFDLSGNQITDLSPLSGNRKMAALVLSGNQVSDLSPLSNMIDLQWLLLDDNQISDTGPLLNMTHIEYLPLDSNPLNTRAYCQMIPAIIENNPGGTLTYDPNPNPITDDCSIDLP
jgi:Leucine-rich repeat (LRR) protein/predicted phosphodiesterase